MSFYIHDPEMEYFLCKLIDRFATESRPELHENISLTWILYNDHKPKPFSGIGTGWLEDKLIYPASVVKLFYACALETWLQKDLLVESKEIRRAMFEMIVNSSNDATSYIVDLLTATTSGVSLEGESWERWKKQRNWINDWLFTLKGTEFKSINCCQKTWNDGPFGRDRDFYGDRNENRNALTTIATAKLMHSLMNGFLLKPKATQNITRILSRSLDLVKRKQDLENQVDGFLGEGLPVGSNLWSKAGLMSEVRHDAAFFSIPNGNKMILVVFTQGKSLARDTFLLPSIASELSQWSFQ